MLEDAGIFSEETSTHSPYSFVKLVLCLHVDVPALRQICVLNVVTFAAGLVAWLKAASETDIMATSAKEMILLFLIIDTSIFVKDGSA